MRSMLAGPNHYKLDPNLEFQMSTSWLLLAGGFSDVRRGTPGGKLVSVKILCVAQNDDVEQLQEV